MWARGGRAREGQSQRPSPSSYSPYSPSVRERDGKVAVGDAEKHAKAGLGNLLPEPV